MQRSACSRKVVWKSPRCWAGAWPGAFHLDGWRSMSRWGCASSRVLAGQSTDCRFRAQQSDAVHSGQRSGSCGTQRQSATVGFKSIGRIRSRFGYVKLCHWYSCKRPRNYPWRRSDSGKRHHFEKSAAWWAELWANYQCLCWEGKLWTSLSILQADGRSTSYSAICHSVQPAIESVRQMQTTFGSGSGKAIRRANGSWCWTTTK